MYKKAERWNAFIEVMKEARREGELAVARGQDPGPERDDRGLSRSSEARRDGGQRLQPDPHHPARQLRGGRRAGRAVRDDEALAGSDRAAAQEGGGRRSRPRTRSRCTLRVANLFLEKFSNQAEAIKAYEAILELDPDNSEALGVRQADVREAPRLGEADRGQPARDRQAHRRRRAQGPPHRGGQARLREDEEAVGLDRAVAEGARGRRRRTSRRWASSRSSTSARRRGTSWARCWSGRWPRPTTPRGSRRSA